MKKILLSMILMIIIFATIGVSIVIAATTGVVNSVTVNLREEPDTTSKILIQVGEETEVTILGESGDWYEVEYDGVTGYISKACIDVESEENIPVTSAETEETDDTDSEEPEETEDTTNVTAETEPEETTDNTGTDTNSDETATEDETSDSNIETYSEITLSEDTEIRLLPSMTSSKSNTIEVGSTVTVLITLNNWVKITDGSLSGWVVKTNLN